MLKNGFLGFNASFMLDFVVTSLVLLVPLLLFSIYVVKYRQKYALHKILQLSLGIILLVAVAAFEVDMRLHGGWQEIVNKDSTQPRRTAEEMKSIGQILKVHLIFAISTPFLWAYTMIMAYKKFPCPPQPNEYSSTHKTLAWLSTIDLVLTSITGVYFYYQSFIVA